VRLEFFPGNQKRSEDNQKHGGGLSGSHKVSPDAAAANYPDATTTCIFQLYRHGFVNRNFALTFKFGPIRNRSRLRSMVDVLRM
jgi:hypothetical protein